MNQAVEDCLVEGYEHLIESIELPDPDDRHVVAAAIHTRADAIVTFNMKDFPPASLKQYRLEAIHPDDFILNQFDLNQADVLIAVRDCRVRLTNPQIDQARYLEILLKQSLPKTVDEISPFSEVI
jgi:hypothetical protein